MMTNELEKQFFDKFGIECNISFHQQFNGAQIPRGLEFYKKREELAKTGIIKIWHKMLNPRPENYCVYWGEYHYPQITDRILLELIRIIGKKPFGYLQCENTYSTNLGDTRDMITVEADSLKEGLLTLAMQNKVVLRIKHQVRTLFEEG